MANKKEELTTIIDTDQSEKKLYKPRTCSQISSIGTKSAESLKKLMLKVDQRNQYFRTGFSLRPF